MSLSGIDLRKKAEFDFMETMAGKRVTMNIDVPPEAIQALRDYCKRKRRKQRDVLAQVVKWFVSQRPPVQRIVEDDLDGELAEAYATWLEELAKQVREERAEPVNLLLAPNTLLDPDTIAVIRRDLPAGVHFVSGAEPGREGPPTRPQSQRGRKGKGE